MVTKLEITKFEIEKTLVLSTAHVSREDFKMIKAQAEADSTKSPLISELMVENHTYGVVVILGDPDHRVAMISDLGTDLSDEFCNCLLLANTLGVDNVRFDEEGTVHPFLELFEW